MIKKISVWTVYALIVGLLIFGAANRTAAKTEQGPLFGSSDEVNERRGQGNESSGKVEENDDHEANDHEESLVEQDWVSLSGQVINVGAEALEIQTETAGILEISGRSWRFSQEIGYVPVEGNEVVVQGFYENGEYKVSTIQDLSNEQIIQLRDEYGKPAWGGGGSK